MGHESPMTITVKHENAFRMAGETYTFGELQARLEKGGIYWNEWNTSQGRSHQVTTVGIRFGSHTEPACEMKLDCRWGHWRGSGILEERRKVVKAINGYITSHPLHYFALSGAAPLCRICWSLYCDQCKKQEEIRSTLCKL